MFIDESRTASKYTNGASAGRGTPTEILIHHWGIDGQSHDGVVSFFERQSTGTSAHFVVSDGRIHCLVSPTDVAWHAGDWPVNLRSIGIECRPEATDGDYLAVAWLIHKLRSEHGDMPLRPHQKYAQTACPGRYDLARLDRLARGTATKPQAGTITPIIKKDWFDMATKDDLRAVLKEESITTAFAKAVWAGEGSWIHNRRLKRREFAETVLGSLEDRIIAEQVTPMRAQLVALSSTVGVLSKSVGGDPAAITKAVSDAVNVSLKNLEATVKLESK